MTGDAAIAVAVEQMRWWRERGWSPRMILAALGVSGPAAPSWDDAVWAIARAWSELPRLDPPFPLPAAAHPYARDGPAPG